jgi:hypothetical protein
MSFAALPSPVPVVIAGPKIALYINEKQFNVAENVSFSIETVVDEISGIDSPYLQELAPNSVRVRGTINGINTRLSGGLQAKNIKPLFNQIAEGSYISIRIEDRQTQEQIFSCFNCMVTNESHSIPSKGVYRINFSFVGIVPLMALDRS